MEALDTLLVSEERLVVVLDLLMPRMKGFEVLTRVAFDNHLATQHGYIICSAKPPTADHIGPHFVALLQRLHIPFITRPFDIDVLLEEVEEIASRLLPEEERGKGGAQGRKHNPRTA